MSNERPEGEINEVLLNGSVLMTTRGDTVEEENLLEDESATDSAGRKIVGLVPPIEIDDALSSTSTNPVENRVITNAIPTKLSDLDNDMGFATDAYSPVDEAGTLDDADYIPFNDVSDASKPKKKTLFSAIVNKLKDTFALKSAIKTHTYEVGTLIPANSNLNTYITEGVYRIAPNATAETISNIPIQSAGKLVVYKGYASDSAVDSCIIQRFTDHYSKKTFVRNTTDGGTNWFNWKEVSYGLHTYEVGTQIPANSDLNTYTTAGVYYVLLNTDATTISNIPPCKIAGKLIVIHTTSTEANHRYQVYYPYNQNYIFTRLTNDGGTNWSAWVSSNNSQVGSGNSSCQIINQRYDNTWVQYKFYYVHKELHINFSLDNGVTWNGDILILDEDLLQSRTHWLYGQTNSTHRILPTDDLNDFTSAGTYQYNYNSDGMPANAPNWGDTRSFKLVVDRYSDDSRSEIMQTITMVNLSNSTEWYRVRTWDSTTWNSWCYSAKGRSVSYTVNGTTKDGLELDTSGANNNRGIIKYGLYDNHLGFDYYHNLAWDGTKTLANTDDISPANVGLGYAVATVSGSAITATITGFQLRAGVIVVLHMTSGLTTACTLNINSTGAKSVKFWNNEDPSYGKPLITGLSTFIYDGTYYRLIARDRTPNVGAQDYVANTSGNILLDWGYGSDRAQIKYSIGDNKLKWNYYKNSAWRGDVYLADYNDLITQMGTAIPSNSNLNDYKTAGVYRIQDQATANTITNIPVALSGKLLVVAITNTTTYNCQIYITNNADNIYMRRQSSNNTWSSWVRMADYNDTGASVAKVGKSILPSWGYTTNVRTYNGITFTFNPSTGEITANGTATEDSNCILSGTLIPYYYYIPKGQYILSGCPSGGSESKYFIRIQYKKADSTMATVSDYGSGATLSIDDYIFCDFANNQHYYIFIKSGQTVTNLVFKPMLRPAFTTADYEPCEDIHKGNCYVGTCETAGGTKDKVAYVDGYFVLRKGVQVAIKFTNTNSYSSSTTNPITLNVNNTGAKQIWYNTNSTSGGGATGTGTWVFGLASRYIYYIYDGTYWIWAGHGSDNNNTNFLRNDASSTLTTTDNNGNISVKLSNINAQASDNGVSSSCFPTSFNILDKNNLIMTRQEAVVQADGLIQSYWYVRNYNGSTTQVGQKGIRLKMNKSGAITYTIDDPFKWNYATGFGWANDTRTSAVATITASLDAYVAVAGGFVYIHFNYDVPANATLNINNQGAHDIYYRSAKIKANILRAGDKGLFLYTGSYVLLAVDRASANEEHIISTSNTTLTSLLTKHGLYVDGYLVGGNLLFCRVEFQFKTSGSVTVPTSENFIQFTSVKMNASSMTWQDLQGYTDYTEFVPVCLYNIDNKLTIRLRQQKVWSNGNTVKTFRCWFTTYVDKT